MQKKIILPLFTILSTVAFSQTENTLEEQFDEVYSKANNYQDYKVVKIVELNKLKKNTLDSIMVYQTALAQMQAEIESQQIELDLLNENLTKVNNDLEAAIARENEISFLGMPTSKLAYNGIVWAIIIILLALLFLFIYKFKNSHVITRETQLKQQELEKEFDLHRQRALEREQQLNRKLIDEINKNK